jgi:hypothetical protein
VPWRQKLNHKLPKLSVVPDLQCFERKGASLMLRDRELLGMGLRVYDLTSGA